VNLNVTASMAIAVDLTVEAIPTNCSGWAELIVKEMSSASDLTDAKNRAFKILNLLEKSAARTSSPDEKSKVNKVSGLLKVKYFFIMLYYEPCLIMLGSFLPS
jgi:hypothetical protein